MQRPETVHGFRIDGTPAEMDVNKLKWRPAAYALIFNAAGELLVLDNHWNNKLYIPGGGIHLHETLEAGLIREVWEETGLRVDLHEMFFMNDTFFLAPSGNHFHALSFFYRATVTGGTLLDTILDGELTVNPHYIDPHILVADDMPFGFDAVQKAIAQFL